MRSGSRRKAVVVGAGVAGLTSAALLARHGYQTTLLERSAAPGGRAGFFAREGFRFDLGPTLLFMPDVFRTAFAECGADFDREVTLSRLETNYRLHFPDGRVLTLSPVLADTIDSLERFEAGSSRGLLRYLSGAARAYQLSRKHFVGERVRSLAQFARPRTVQALLQSGAFRSLHRTARAAFGSDTLSAALSFQSMYLGMSPYDSPELYRLLFFTEMGEGIFYPQGGIGALVRALERVAVRNGVNVVYGAPVTRVERGGEAIRSVIAGDERYEADIVLFTADLPYVYNELLGERHRSHRMRLTPSALLIYAALETRYDIGHHEFVMPGDLRETCDDIFKRGIFPREPAVYASSAVASDPECAPDGKSALYVLVPVPNLNGSIDWRRATTQLAERSMQILEERLLPGLRANVRWYEVRTPLDFAESLNLHRGSAFGLSHDIMQIGPLRPDSRHARLRNAYFAGASTRPATGLPLVTLGAMQTVQRIREEIPA